MRATAHAQRLEPATHARRQRGASTVRSTAASATTPWSAERATTRTWSTRGRRGDGGNRCRHGYGADRARYLRTRRDIEQRLTGVATSRAPARSTAGGRAMTRSTAGQAIRHGVLNGGAGESTTRDVLTEAVGVGTDRCTSSRLHAGRIENSRPAPALTPSPVVRTNAQRWCRHSPTTTPDGGEHTNANGGISYGGYEAAVPSTSHGSETRVASTTRRRQSRSHGSASTTTSRGWRCQWSLTAQPVDDTPDGGAGALTPSTAVPERTASTAVPATTRSNGGG